MVKCLSANKNGKKLRKEYMCPLCKNKNRKYNSSAFGRHLRTVHGPKWECKFCLKKYADKNSHKICFEKERLSLKSFIENLIFGKSSDKSSSPCDLNFSYIFSEKKHAYYSPKFKLGQGHFSEVFYGFDKNTKKEIAVKISRNKNKIIKYDIEENILKKLESTDFFPKVFHYNDEFDKDYLEITLMGPTLLDFQRLCDYEFDRKTIINVFQNLLYKIKYNNTCKILHRDIKPENIVLGIIENSQLKYGNDLFFIDYGMSQYMDENFAKKKNIDNSWKCGTYDYMSIGSHQKFKPTILDDIESLIYTVIELSRINLPWKHLRICNYQRNNILLDKKKKLNIIQLCEEEFDFIAKIYFYINKVKKENLFLDFDVINEILDDAKKIKKYDLKDYKSKYCFLAVLEEKLMDFIYSGKPIPIDPKLMNLLGSYPIDYQKLYKSLKKYTN